MPLPNGGLSDRTALSNISSSRNTEDGFRYYGVQDDDIQISDEPEDFELINSPDQGIDRSSVNYTDTSSQSINQYFYEATTPYSIKDQRANWCDLSPPLPAVNIGAPGYPEGRIGHLPTTNLNSIQTTTSSWNDTPLNNYTTKSTPKHTLKMNNNYENATFWTAFLKLFPLNVPPHLSTWMRPQNLGLGSIGWIRRTMRLLLTASASITILFILSQSLSAAIPAEHEGQVVLPAQEEKNNLTNLTGEDLPAGNSTLEQKGAAIVGNEAEEKKRSLAIFFILFVIVIASLLVHVLIISKVHYIPESLAIVILGAIIGMLLSYTKRDWSEIEALSPDIFFLVLLPPIIFENAYNLNKGYFFSNIVPILTFAILGTAISAFVIGTAVFILGQADLIYPLTIFESFAFASMISAVDPVATLAIFQAVKVEGLLYMLVFGESMLNDAVSIVLAATAVRHSRPTISSLSTSEILSSAIMTFIEMFCVSAILGAAIGLLSALLFKHVDLRRTPSLELALLLVFAYIPYGLAEALSLSGIMAILFCGITMSQYTQHNISPVTQITMRQTFRTISFVAETSTFAYLGMAFFTIKLNFQPSFVFWSIVLCLISRACNIFPLSFLVNKCRKDVQISMKNQIIMWFSGMRGAVCFALALYLDVDKETKSVVLTTTLFLLLFTIIFMGGSALPFINFINRCYPDKPKRRRRRSRSRNEGNYSEGSRPILLSKTQEMSMFGSQEWKIQKKAVEKQTRAGALMKTFFVRRFTAQEREENKEKLNALTKKALEEHDSWSTDGHLSDGHIRGQESDSDECLLQEHSV